MIIDISVQNNRLIPAELECVFTLLKFPFFSIMYARALNDYSTVNLPNRWHLLLLCYETVSSNTYISSKFHALKIVESQRNWNIFFDGAQHLAVRIRGRPPFVRARACAHHTLTKRPVARAARMLRPWSVANVTARERAGTMIARPKRASNHEY